MEKILFIDLETVSQTSSYDLLSETMQHLWDKKAERLQQPGQDPRSPQELFSRAGIYAEFGKVICISAGIVADGQIRIRSYASDNEHELLKEFAAMLDKNYQGQDCFLCAHNGKEFDFPYLCRRMLIQGIRLPVILDIAGRKPWEVRHYDTLEMWKFGDYKHYTSLELLAAVFGIPTPKDDIDGSMVNRVYWEEHDLPRIVKYCQKDVITLIQLFRRYQSKGVIPEENIVIREMP